MSLPVNLLITPIVDIIGKIFTNKAEKDKALAELALMQETGELQNRLAQIEVNKVEAQSQSLFVAGWRPFMGWACGAALIYAALLEPVLRFAAVVLFDYAGQFPVIDTAITMQVLFGLLGLGAYRTYEKTKK